jgi:HTH-type transcriptional regulator/antitoxin HigA
MDDIRPIRSEADYDWALAEIERYFDRLPEPGTPEADRFDVLTDLIEAFEARHWPIEAPDPVELIREVMTARGYGPKRLGEVLGSAPRASEVLCRKRRLSLGMIRRLHHAWGIPADLLIAPYQLHESAGPTRRRARAHP